MKKATLVLALVVTILFGCKNGEKKEVASEEIEEVEETVDSAVIDGHNSQNSLDWSGVYEGVVPCADCEGIKTVLELKDDGTYLLSETYLGESDDELKSTGNFYWDDAGSNITLENADANRMFKVGENQIFMLDMQGNRVKGDMADLYILKKTIE
ncbi:copper resistance protein NlpE [Aequorivita marina]|uniref:copper resistance protein NlpE n=1 Tax=Aequorivita marina TaxID=3073654 RepID=UPI002874CB4A|nr:copper resistance protein NlpE [Aequorivita sp. S2608]MDS1299749.1 copper resistance protein NlpE [Aequorivita sp. S2608]